jgi:multidrug transporter EmrE-like cation transporter
MAYLLLVSLIFCRTFSDICFKFAVHQLPLTSFQLFNKNIKIILKSPATWAGITFSISNFILWMFVLNYFDLSYAYPFMSICYLSIMISGKFFFGETIGKHKLIGMGFIIIGTLLLFKG